MIVDVQNDFVHPEGHIAKVGAPVLERHDADPAMLENIERFLETSRRFGV